MSHVATVETKLTDLQAVKAACERMGWQFVEGQKKYAWYGRSVGDYSAADNALDHGMTEADLGKCDHAIKVPGAKYEIGLVKKDNGYVPAWDWYAAGGLQNIRSENGLGGFMQAYAIEKTKIEMRRKGMVCSEKKLADGRIQLHARAT